LETEERIDRIVCFGLGDPKGDHCFLLHAAAATIVMRLGYKHGVRPKTETCDQDNCDASKQLLAQSFNFTFYNRLDALLHVDEYTFVMCMEPNDAVSQFTIDLCHDKGGPAALLSKGVFNVGKCILGSIPGDHIATCGEDYSHPQLYAWANYCRENSSHISIEH
jgi:hypothetical protein